jgi:hypothetical protein
MTELALAVESAEPDRYAAMPTLTFRLRASETTGVVVHAIALRCQLRVEPRRRPYTDRESAGLTDLFGLPDRYGDTMTPFLWTHATALVPGFTGEVAFDLPVLATYDFDVAAVKYLHALAGGHVPLTLLFSGTVFTRGATGFAVEQVPWHIEARYALPVSTWHALMDLHFPATAWLRVRRDTLDALAGLRSARGLTSWDDTFDALLAGGGAPAGGATLGGGGTPAGGRMPAGGGKLAGGGTPAGDGTAAGSVPALRASAS